MSDPNEGGAATCSCFEFSQERRNDGFPARLDEALKYAVAQVEKDLDKARLIIGYFGWDGRNPRKLDELSVQFRVPHERIKEVVAQGLKKLRSSGLLPEALRRSIELANRLLPVLDIDLCEALLQARLCYVRFSCGSLVTAAEVFTGRCAFEEAIIGENSALVKSGNTKHIDDLAAFVRYLMQTRGCLNTAELAEEFRAVIGTNTTRRLTESLARSAGAFEWLDHENGWFWYVPEHGAGKANALLNCIRQSFAVTPRMQLTELQSAIGRELVQAPPLNVLAAICRRLLFVRVEGDTVIRIPNLLVWDVVKKEASFKKLVRNKEAVRGWLSDGRLFIAWKLDQLSLESGVLRVHEPMSSLIEGDYELVTLGDDKLSDIQIRQRACWDTRPLLKWRNANAGDTLVLIFDRQRRRATGIVGDDEFAAQVA
jgi:hypothetical protein